MNKETLKEYRGYLWKRWLIDVCIRTIKTGCETAAGLITVGAVISEIDWVHVLSVTAVAMIYTILVNTHKIASELVNTNKIASDSEPTNKCE